MALDYTKYLNTAPKKTTSVQGIVSSVLKISTVTADPTKQVNPPSKSPFNPNTPGHDEFVKQMDQRAPSTSVVKNFVSSIPGAFKTTVKAPVKFVTDPYLRPSETEKQIEANFPTNHGLVGKVASAVAKPITRTFEPIVEGLGSQIGTAIGSKGKVLPTSREAFIAGANFGFGAGGSFVGGEAAKGKAIPYQEKTSFIKGSELWCTPLSRPKIGLIKVDRCTGYFKPASHARLPEFGS
jgi:hypothetical protein